MRNFIQLLKSLLNKLTYGLSFFLVSTSLILGIAFIIGHLTVSHLTLDILTQHATAIVKTSKLIIYLQLVIGGLVFVFWYRIFGIAFEKEWLSKINRSKLAQLRWNYFAVFLCVMVIILMGLNQ